MPHNLGRYAQGRLWEVRSKQRAAVLVADARCADGARYTPREISKCFRILLVKTRNLLHVFTRSASQRATGTFGSAQDDAGKIGLLHDAA